LEKQTAVLGSTELGLFSRFGIECRNHPSGPIPDQEKSQVRVLSGPRTISSTLSGSLKKRPGWRERRHLAMLFALFKVVA